MGSTMFGTRMNAIDSILDQRIHVIADNLSAHKNQRVEERLVTPRSVYRYFTPTTRLGLTQSRCNSPISNAEVIAPGVYASVFDLKRKPIRYIRQYNKNENAKPVNR